MNKLNQILGLFLVIQVGIIGVSQVVAKDAQGPSVVQKIFPELDPKTIDKIVIHDDSTGDASNAPITLEKRDAQWRVASAEGYPADSGKIDGFLQSVQKMVTTGVVATSAAYHKKLEVADGHYKRKVELSGGGVDRTFYVGTAKTMKRVHVRSAGEAVFEAKGLSVWDIGGRAAEWVNKTYVDVPDAEVWSVGIERANDTLQLEKSPAGTWLLVGSSEALKATEVEALVSKARKVDLDIPAGRALKPEFGLASPLATVTIGYGKAETEGERPAQLELRRYKIGAKTSDDRGYYIKSDNSAFVVSAAKWALDPLLEKTAAELFE